MDEKKYNFGDIRAIIGLGNPGQNYQRTRHNIGFRVVDAFANGGWRESALMYHAEVVNEESQRALYLIKPLTYMNKSGQVLSFLLKKGVVNEQILVIHDELEKPFGRMGVRWNGSFRGHNGLRSIGEVIGKEFWRLQFGIGRPDEKNEVSDYVLSPFLPQEEEEMGGLLEKAVSLIKEASR